MSNLNNVIYDYAILSSLNNFRPLMARPFHSTMCRMTLVLIIMMIFSEVTSRGMMLRKAADSGSPASLMEKNVNFAEEVLQ